jgi:hypothetical protein
MSRQAADAPEQVIETISRAHLQGMQAASAAPQSASVALPSAPPPPPPAPVPAPPAPAAARIPVAGEWRLPDPITRAPVRTGQSPSNPPPELLLVSSLMGIAALFCLWLGLKPLPDTLQLTFSGNSFGAALGGLILAVLLVFVAFGASCLYLAWRLTLADKVARGLSYVVLAGLGVSILVTGANTTNLKLTMAAAFVALGILVLSPNVQRFFQEGPDSLLPVPVTVACTLLQAWAAVMGLVGLCLLPGGAISGRLVFGALIMLGLAVLVLWCAREVKAGNPTGRVCATVGAAIYGVLTLIVGRNNAGVLVPLSLAVGVVAVLWLPAQSQEYFNRAPQVDSRLRDSAWLASLSDNPDAGDG